MVTSAGDGGSDLHEGVRDVRKREPERAALPAVAPVFQAAETLQRLHALRMKSGGSIVHSACSRAEVRHEQTNDSRFTSLSGPR